MNDHSRAHAIFGLMRQLNEGDAQARQQLRTLAEDHFEFPGSPHDLLIISCQIANARECFIYDGWGRSFFIPSSFALKDVQRAEGVYTFLAQDGRVLAATLPQLERAWDALPWGRITAGHVERAFLSCHRECNVAEIDCPPIGAFQLEDGCFRLHVSRWQDRRLAVFVHVRLADDFDQCVTPMMERLNRLSEFETMARNEFRKVFGVTEAELNAITLDQFDFYLDGEFDLTYGLPESEAVEYVRAWFSASQELAGVSFGNY